MKVEAMFADDGGISAAKQWRMLGMETYSLIP